MLLDRGHDGLNYLSNSAWSLHYQWTDMKVLAIGIGNNVNVDDLNIIANNKLSNVFNEANSSLVSISKFASFKTCSGTYFLNFL